MNRKYSPFGGGGTGPYLGWPPINGWPTVS